jgi:hypothetical protein
MAKFKNQKVRFMTIGRQTIFTMKTHRFCRFSLCGQSLGFSPTNTAEEKPTKNANAISGVRSNFVSLLLFLCDGVLAFLASVFLLSTVLCILFVISYFKTPIRWEMKKSFCNNLYI